MMGGIFWTYCVSSHRGEMSTRQQTQLSISDNGPLKIYGGGPESTAFISNQLKAFEDAGK